MKHDYFKKLVAAAIEALYGVTAQFAVEWPKDMAHGDYATNAALVVAKQLGKNPMEIAEALAAYLDAHKEHFVASVRAVAPGFINFTISRIHLVDAIKEAANVDTYGHTNVYTGKHILVEHSSPNLFKPFHIGHLMNNTIGEAITRLARYSGAQVTTMSFPSDISLGVAKAVFILLEKSPDGQLSSPKINILGDAYVEGTKRYDEDESIHSKVKEIADNLYADIDSPELKAFVTCRDFNIKYFEHITKQLGSHFDAYIYESEAGVDGKKIVLENTPKVFTESEGAVVYMPDASAKLHTAVFINSQGNPTYEAKDIGLLDLKFKKYNPDLSIFITDAQQVSHFQVVLDAAEKIDLNWKAKSLHRYHGRMSFKGQKMSSRLGGVPIVEDVLSTVIEEVKSKNPDVSDEAAQQIGIAAIKFAILRAAAGKNIDFDPDTSLSFEGDSGPYLQYTAVRAQSLLSKGAEAGISPDAATAINGTEMIERLVARFPEIMTEAQRDWAPHTIVGYLLDLAQAFNSWYGQGKIIDEDKQATAYRLAVVKAVRQTLTNGLYVLGIEVPERM
jgi:arginyl-tRNA synthetase